MPYRVLPEQDDSKPEEKRRVSLRQLLFKNCAALSGVCVRCQGVGCRENYKSAAEAAPLAGVLCKDFRLQEEPKEDQPHGQPGGQVWYQEQCQCQEQLRYLVNPGEESQQCRGHADQGNQPGG